MLHHDDVLVMSFSISDLLVTHQCHVIDQSSLCQRHASTLCLLSIGIFLSLGKLYLNPWSLKTYSSVPNFWKNYILVSDVYGNLQLGPWSFGIFNLIPDLFEFFNLVPLRFLLYFKYIWEVWICVFWPQISLGGVY